MDSSSTKPILGMFEAVWRLEGSVYLGRLPVSVSIPQAAGVMKCLSCQVIKTALGKLCLMVAALNS